MKILIIAKRPTHPTDAGSRRFILSQVEQFKKMGHDVHYLYIHEEWHPKRWGSNEYIEKMIPYWKDHLHIRRVNILTVLWYYALIGFRVVFRHGYQKVDDTYPCFLSRQVNKLNNKYHFDACVINYYELSRLFDYINIPLKAITTHDYYAYKTDLMGKRYVKLSTDAHQEALAMQRCPNIFALNTEEAVYFSKLSPKSTVYNVFSTYTYRPSKIVGNKIILFLSGNNNYNQHAIEWFIQEIFPTINQRHPTSKLKVGGSICKYLKNNYSNHPNIELVGFVDDADAFYESADVVINPTFEGTGLKIKTFESIAYDKVTMAHPHSMTGIYNPESAPIFASVRPGEWADYLDDIWTNVNSIDKIKESNKIYMEKMMKHVRDEYQRFFSQADITKITPPNRQ